MELLPRTIGGGEAGQCTHIGYYMKSKDNEQMPGAGAGAVRKTGLDRIAGADARFLILGSLPGEESLARSEYYAHKRNRFWRIMSVLCGEDMPESYAAKVDMLQRHGIALWDVLHAAEREGSMDANIRNDEPNDILALLQLHPGIRTIGLNGRKAETQFLKYNDIRQLQGRVRIVSLRSTSPANAQFSDEQMLENWRQLFEDGD